MAFQPPVNKLLVSVRQKFRRGITNVVRAANLTESNQINPLDWVSIQGEVVSLPKQITNEKREYEGYSLRDIEPGDILIFSYDVIGNYLPPDGTDQIVHRNEVFYRGKSYFVCDITRAFARIRGGEILMLNGYVMIAPPEEPKILLPAYMKRERSAACSEVLQIGNTKYNEEPTGAKQGDIVYYNPNRIQRYQIGEKKFAIISQEHILGRSV
jgi:co-chaperonin GroES (HSP10)